MFDAVERRGRPVPPAGKNAYAIGAKDLGGNPRIAGGTVDIGAYEYQSPSSHLSYAWAQPFNLPTDGTADLADTDNDGLNNWQEWVAGTSPTDGASVLKLYSLATNTPGLTVSWLSVTGRTCFRQRAAALLPPAAFSVVKTNINGRAGSTAYTDTTATNGGP